MKERGFEQKLISDFEAWRNGKLAVDDVADLNKSIIFASDNGIDLVLKVSNSILERVVNTRSRVLQDLSDSPTKEEGTLLTLDILSKKKAAELNCKRLEVRVMQDYQHLGPCVVVRSVSDGFITPLFPDEVSSIGLK